MQHQQLSEEAAGVQEAFNPNAQVIRRAVAVQPASGPGSTHAAPHQMPPLPQLPFPQLPFTQGHAPQLESAGGSLPPMESGSLPTPLSGEMATAQLHTSPAAPLLGAAAVPAFPMAAGPAAGVAAMPSDFNGSTDHLTEATEGEESRGDSPLSSRGRGRGRGGGRSARYRNTAGLARKSRYRGVQWERSCNKWRARIHTDKTRHIGYFEEEDAAAEAFDMAALKHFGLAWKSKLNFPERSVARFLQSQQAAGPGGAGGLAAAAGAPRGATGAAAGEAAGEAAAKAYRGVQTAEGGKFRAVLQRKRAFIIIGTYSTAEEAARAYDRENLRVNGRGAITNFPLSDYAADLERWQEAYNLITASQGCGATSSGGALTLPALPASSSRLALASVLPSTADATTPVSCQGPSFPFPPQPPHGEARGAAMAHPGSMTADGARALSGPSGGGALGSLSGLPAGVSGAVAAALGGPEISNYASKRRKGEAGGHLGIILPSAPALGAALEAAGGLRGVVQVGDRWQAYLTADLGSFSSAEEAARAHDRAALAVLGLAGGALNFPVQEVLSESKAACAAVRVEAQQAQQPGEGRARVEGFRGVMRKGDSYLAILDIGGKLHDLGPFPSALDAAKAYDRYSLLLLGTQATTNFPAWEYLVSEPEVQALVGALQEVTMEKAQQAQQVQQQEHAAAAPAPSQLSGAAAVAAAAGREGTPEQQAQQDLPRPSPSRQSLTAPGLPGSVPLPSIQFGTRLPEQQCLALGRQAWPDAAAGPLNQGLRQPEQQQQAVQPQSVRLPSGGMLQYLHISLPPPPAPHPYFQQQQQQQQSSLRQALPPQQSPPRQMQHPQQQHQQQQHQQQAWLKQEALEGQLGLQQGPPPAAAPASPAQRGRDDSPSLPVDGPSSRDVELSLDAFINALSPFPGWLPSSLDSLCAQLHPGSGGPQEAAPPSAPAPPHPPSHWATGPGALGSPFNLLQQQQQPQQEQQLLLPLPQQQQQQQREQEQQVPLLPMKPSFLGLAPDSKP